MPTNFPPSKLDNILLTTVVAHFAQWTINRGSSCLLGYILCPCHLFSWFLSWWHLSTMWPITECKKISFSLLNLPPDFPPGTWLFWIHFTHTMFLSYMENILHKTSWILLTLFLGGHLYFFFWVLFVQYISLFLIVDRNIIWYSHYGS